MSVWSVIGGVAKGALKVVDVALDVATGPIDLVAKILPPGVGDVLKVGMGAVTGNPILIASGVTGLAGDVINSKSGPKTELPNAGKHAETAGYAKPKNVDSHLPPFRAIEELLQRLGLKTASDVPVRYDKNSHLDSHYEQYVDALKVLDQNWLTFDSAAGARDSYIRREDLQAIANNPHASEDLKKAARFLLQHGEYFSRLEMAAGVGGRDGIIGHGDVKGALETAKKDLAQYGVRPPAGAAASATAAPAASHHGASCGAGPAPTNGGSSSTASTNSSCSSGAAGSAGTEGKGSPGASKEIQGILRDPTMSVESKVLAVLSQGLSDLDEEMKKVMTEMENKGADSQTIQYKLQDLMEKRSRMYSLMTTLSSKFNEMSKAAIQNIGKA